MSSRSQVVLHTALLMALCGALYFPFLGSIPFFDKGEPREALAVQDIVQRGDWLVPLKRATDVPSKPPLMHWSAALVTKATGSLTEATIRFPSAVYATFGVLLIYWLGRKMFDANTALLGAAILATTMVYQDQAVSARVDMTLCFFVTASLALFYALYRGYLTHPGWFYVFYVVVGIGTLAKGPLSVVLTALVAGSLTVIERRWDLLRRFCFHPGVALMLVLGTGWYVIAVIRGGEGFFDRQIWEENLSRFVGGSGHSHPFYHYVPYVFSQAMPWGLFFPLVFWDVYKTGLKPNGERLYLKLWFLIMFVFFSISMGKRAVYLLPIYPALSLLLAAWLREAGTAGKCRVLACRAIALFSGLTGALLLVVILGVTWNEIQSWIFAPIEAMLRPKDRANLVAVRHRLDDFGWTFTLLAISAAILWFFVARSLWFGKLGTVAKQLIGISLIHGVVGWSVVMPVIAQEKSYREFMIRVNERIPLEAKLYLYGVLNGDSLIFYRERVIERLEQPVEVMAKKTGNGDGYLIMTVQTFEQIQKAAGDLPPPLLKSVGKGPEGDEPLVLLRGDVP